MKAIILCGGKGSRLAEETKLIPKPMVKVGSLPIVVHIINHLRFYGIKEIILQQVIKVQLLKSFFIITKNLKILELSILGKTV